MIRARQIDVEEEPDKIPVIVMPHAVIDPRAVMVCVIP